MVSGFEIEAHPELRSPVAVVAFTGWNDAANAATGAARFMVSRLGAQKFARLPAEDYFDFRSSRPSVKISPDGERSLSWPALELFSARGGGSSDLIIGLGAEPSLRWKLFSREVTGALESLGTRLTITLGALLSDAPHTRPVRVSGSAPDPATASALGLAVTKYEGPTGIIGTLNEALRARSMPAASIWANCPHYVSTNQNPPATAALVEKLSGLIGMTFDTSDLRLAGERFVNEVDSAVAANPEIAEYVRRLESAADRDSPLEEDQRGSSEDLFGDIARFLREDGPERDL